MLPKITAYVKSYDGQTKWIYFLIKDDDLFGKYNADIKKEFYSKFVYNNEFLKTKIKSNGDEVTDFSDKKFL